MACRYLQVTKFRDHTDYDTDTLMSPVPWLLIMLITLQLDIPLYGGRNFFINIFFIFLQILRSKKYQEIILLYFQCYVANYWCSFLIATHCSVISVKCSSTVWAEAEQAFIGDNMIRLHDCFKASQIIQSSRHSEIIYFRLSFFILITMINPLIHSALVCCVHQA